MNVRLHELAQAELDDAFEWYESQLSGLGARFIQEFDDTVSRIIDFPAIGPKLAPGIRRCLLPRFPFGVIYAADESDLSILAVAHLHREPRYWVDRL